MRIFDLGGSIIPMIKERSGFVNGSPGKAPPVARVDRAGIFHRLPHLDDSRLAELFAREVLALLIDKGLISREWAERILSWRHTDSNVHSRVRARTRTEAERIGKYLVRPILALERLLILEREAVPFV